MYSFCFYFFMFFIFSVIGWVLECISCSFYAKKFVHNRGFLIGPYCPVYGFGTLFTYIFLTKYKSDPVVLFIMALVCTSILEYITSLGMEKLFKARWWDYSDRRFNLEGRICLRNGILFGIMGITFTYLVFPIYNDLVEKIPSDILILISVILFIIIMTDFIVTTVVMSKIKNKVTNMEKDSTNEIEIKVKKELFKYRFYLRKLLKSFPDLTFKIPSNDLIIKSITKTLNTFEGKNRKKNLR